MYEYLIKLKPLDMFFFGGEITFSSGGEVKSDEEGKGTSGRQDKRKNYLVTSNLFPQQTSLLGMIRKQLLKNKNMFKENPKDYTQHDIADMKKLIGERSFSFGGRKEKQSFGVIENLSPVFIMKKDEMYVSVPLDDSSILNKPSSENNEGNHHSTMSDGVCVSHNKSNSEKRVYKPYRLIREDGKTNFGDSIFLLENYEPKKGLSEGLLNVANGEIITVGDVFQEVEKIGIRIQKKGMKQEDDYYKQTFYRLNNDYYFAFYVTLKEKLDESSNLFATLGGEGSTFKLELECVDDKSDPQVCEFPNCLRNSVLNKEKEEKKDCYDKIILISDTFFEEDIHNYCVFNIIMTEDFRNFNYRSGNYTYSKKNISNKYTMIKKGSVLYTDKPEALKSKIDEYKGLKQIGYNYYI